MRKVKLTYFKESGKYYSEGEYNTEIEEYHDWLIYKEVIEMHPLPGLIGGWDGQVLVIPDNGVPALVRFVRHNGCPLVHMDYIRVFLVQYVEEANKSDILFT